MEGIVGEVEVKKIWRSWSWRRMGKASSSTKVAALILFSLAAVTGELILMTRMMMTGFNRSNLA